MSKTWPGGLIRKTPVTPAGPYQTGAAPGVWTLGEAAYWTKQGLWPIAGNTPSWIGLLYSTSSDDGYGVATDATGNVYVCGHSQAGGLSSMQLAKYNTSGTIQWQRRLSGSQSIAYSVSVDSSGNVYICGQDDSAGGRNIQIAKYNSSGTIQWQRYVYNYGYEALGQSIAVDSSGNAYVCGYAFDISNGRDAYIFKFNTSGVLQWERRLSSSSSTGDYSFGIALDSSSNVYICGVTGSSALIAKYNSSGAIQWQRTLSANTNSANSTAVDTSGNVYVCGSSDASGSSDLLIVKYNTSGVLQWQRRLGGSGGDNAMGIAVDIAGNSYVCGLAYDGSKYRLQLAKYDTSGAIQWQRQLSHASGNLVGRSVSVDGSGNLCICGQSNASGTNEIIFAKLPADGSKTGTYTVGGYSFTYAASSLTDAASSLTSAASGLTDSAGGLSGATSTLTDAASTLTSSVTTL